MFRRLSSAVCALVFTLPAMAAAPLREAPNLAAKPANQLVVSGPTALLNAFRFGNHHWQRGLLNITGTTGKEQSSSLLALGVLKTIGHPKEENGKLAKTQQVT